MWDLWLMRKHVFLCHFKIVPLLSRGYMEELHIYSDLGSLFSFFFSYFESVNSFLFD